MPVYCFDGCAVKNEDKQQQTKTTFQGGAMVLKCAGQHAVLVWGSRIVLTGTPKTQFT